MAKKRGAKGLSGTQEELADVRRNPERYLTLGLTANPFPAGGLAPSNPQIEPLPAIRDQIVGFLRRFLESGSSNGLVLLGSYGAGKTYHLNYIRSILKGATYNIRIVHIVDPGLHPYHVIRSILLNISEEEVAKMMWSIIGPYLRQQQDTNPSFFEGMVRVSGSSRKNAPPFGQNALNMVMAKFSAETWLDHRLFLRDLERQILINREQLVHAVTPILTSRDEPHFITPIKQIAEDLAGVCLYDGVPALERWKAMTEGVGSGAIQPGNERDFLTALLYLLKQNGVEYFILLLDEFEKVPQLERMTDKDARLYLDTLRMLIDEGHQHLPFAYIIGSNPDAWKLAIEKIAPLQDRFTEINLPTMIDDNIAAYMVTAHLAEVRPEGYRAPDPRFPFPSDFPSSIPADSRRTARQLVKLCHTLIERAVEERLPEVTEELINLTLEERYQESGE